LDGSCKVTLTMISSRRSRGTLRFDHATFHTPSRSTKAAY
jgi:hypothetical protein